MFLEKIIIKNFKGIEKIEISCDKSFNVIIGQNSIGKTSIFEALLLWKQCYDKSIKQNNKSFLKETTKKYLLFSELEFLRVTNDTDLFWNKEKAIEVCLTINNNDCLYALGFKIERSKTPSNAYFRILYNDFAQFDAFAQSLTKKLNEAIFLYKTQPISNIPAKEPFMSNGQILRKLSKGKSHEVLRNKIIKNRTTSDKLRNLEITIMGILENDFSFKLKNTSSEEYIDLVIISQKKELDIHLQGSGFLQVAEIISSIEYFDSALNILLVDEPDSHIHARLQKNLINELKSNHKTQTFVITHNESFVDNLINECELFLFNNDSKSLGTLLPIKITDLLALKEELGGTITGLEKVSLCNKLFFVEGDDDAKYLKRLLEKYNNIKEDTNKMHIEFLYLRGKDNLETKIEYILRTLRQVFNAKQFGVIFDKDFCTKVEADEQNKRLKKKVHSDLVYYHDGYCIESTLFSSIDILNQFLHKISDIAVENIAAFTEEHLGNLIAECSNVTSSQNSTLSQKFHSQKKQDRPELEKVRFEDFVKESCANIHLVHFLMNKENIKEFILAFEVHYSVNITSYSSEDKAEVFSRDLFEKYIGSIDNLSDIYPSHLELLELMTK
ncbi:ATP-dependent nuclease [Bacillus thuringiensis]|uniref:ATP-dependent nuclease n=2 Tax=Bacillus cereus group TaxID=86661 RepID=UPI000BFE5197|nr:ATP-binding protein [Bacillus thuringiensis]PGQ49754.1 hypothetical protein COA20_05380 [Bacillus thuringiensis]